MKSQTTTRAALIAALSILAAIIGIALSMQHENGDVFVEIKPIPTPKATNMISSTPLPSPTALPSPTPEATLQPTYPSAATPAPVQDGKAFSHAQYSERYHIRGIRRGRINAQKNSRLAYDFRIARREWYVRCLRPSQP